MADALERTEDRRKFSSSIRTLTKPQQW